MTCFCFISLCSTKGVKWKTKKKTPLLSSIDFTIKTSVLPNKNQHWNEFNTHTHTKLQRCSTTWLILLKRQVLQNNAFPAQVGFVQITVSKQDWQLAQCHYWLNELIKINLYAADICCTVVFFLYCIWLQSSLIFFHFCIERRSAKKQKPCRVPRIS